MLYIKKKAEDELNQKIIEALNAAKIDCKERQEAGDVKAARYAFDHLRVKEDIKESLLQEQHGLCAYCMQEITPSSARIEHWKPLSKNTEDALEYSNMFAVCYGGEHAEEPSEEFAQGKGRKGLCCDASKGDHDITLNPCNYSHMVRICYSDEDVFMSTQPRDETLNRDINDVLHLNGIIRDGQLLYDTKTNLVHNRREVYRSFRAYIDDLEEKYTPDEVSLRIKERIKSLETSETYVAFVGVILYFLKRELKKYRNIMSK